MKKRPITRATALLMIIALCAVMYIINVYSIDWTTTEVVSTESTEDSLSPCLGVGSDGTVHIAWYGKADYGGSGEADIFYKRLVPSTGWTTTEIVSTESTWSSRRPSLAVGPDGTVHIAWDDETWDDGSGTDTDIFYKRLVPSTGWTTTEVVTTESTYGSYSPCLGVGSDGTVHIAWTEYANYGGSGFETDIFYKRLVPSSGWTTMEIVTTESTSVPLNPSLAVGPDGTVHITWIEYTDYGDSGTDSDVFYKRLVPGTGWTAMEVVSTESTDTSYSPCLGVGSDGTVHIAWEDSTDDYGGSGFDHDVFYKRFVPSSGWTTAEVVSTESTHHVNQPCLAVGSDGSVHIAWTEDTDNYDYDNYGYEQDVFYKRFVPSSGWTTAEVVSTESASRFTNNPCLGVGSDGTVHIAWEDSTDYGGSGTDADIFYKKGLDLTAPMTVDDYDGQWHTTDFTITLTATDDFSSVYETYYKINDGPLRRVNIHGNPVINIEGANNKLEYWSVDAAANEELPHKTLIGIKLDKTAPIGSVVINNGDSETSSTSVALSLTFEDTLSGVCQVRYSNDGVWDSEAWETPSGTKEWTLTSGDGIKNVYYQVEDNAGLLSSTYSDTITLTATSPSVPTGSIVINNGDASTSSESVTLSLTFEDAVSGVVEVRYSNDGVWDTEAWEAPATTKSWLLTSGDGEKTVYYQIKNNAGTLSSTYSDTITLSTAAPTVPIGSIVINNGAASTSSVSVTLSLTYEDPFSGVSQVRYSNDGVWDTEAWETPSGTKEWTLTSGDETKTVYYQIKNNAGLISETYSDTIILSTTTTPPPPAKDTTKPTANAGSDQTINEDTTVTFDGSASSDNVGVTSYTWTFTDGTAKTLTGMKPSYIFSTPGVYTVTLKVEDAAGNSATDTVVVSVSDVTEPVADAGEDVEARVNTSVHFDCSSSSDNVRIIIYEWDFGDGTSGTGKTVSHTYANAGTYTVTLTVRDEAGNLASDSVVVAVYEAGATPLWMLGAVVAVIAAVTIGVLLLWRRQKTNSSSKQASQNIALSFL